MDLVLRGKIITPIVMKKTVFQFEGCTANISNPKRKYLTKSHKQQRIYPFSFIAWLGKIELRYRCKSIQKAKTKLLELLKIESIGRFDKEGLGRIEWLNGKIKGKGKQPNKRFFTPVKIRKGLPHNINLETQKLLRYALLHDFVNNDRHKSKIYVEPNFENVHNLAKHHDKQPGNSLIQKFQRFDCQAAIISRKIRSPRTNRYRWSAIGKINFRNLANELEEVSKKSIWKLYEYIYESKELESLSESLQYGHSSLRYHLLLIANLIVQDFLRNFS